LFAEFSAPLHRDPRWRYAFSADLRKENWDVTRALIISGTTTDSPQAFRFETVKAGAQLTRILGPDWRWTSGVQFSDRRFSHLAVDPAFASDFLRDGPALKYFTEFIGTPLRLPEHRLVTATTLHFSTGKQRSSSSGKSFTTVAAGARTQYLPQATGDDYAVCAQFRAGKTFGDAPLDELFILGVERDSDLWLRAHAATRNGRKGSAPIGRGFALINTELDKNIYDAGFLRIKAGPFLDAGRAYDASPALGSGMWLVDAGVQLKLTVFGAAGVTLSYGRGLRDGRSALYASPIR
jgi:hypothetical protein